MVKTTNTFGTISVTNEAIAIIAAKAALECYGVVTLATKKLKDSFEELYSKHGHSSAVKVSTVDNRISLELFVILKYGINLSATCETMKESIKFKVEKFTGMIVDTVNINVMGVRV